MKYLSFFIPKTLWGQLVSLLLLALVVSQSIALFIFFDAKRLYQNNISQEELVKRVVTTVKLLKHSPRDVAKQIFREANTRSVKIRFAKRPALGKDDKPEYSLSLQQKIIKALPEKNRQVIVVSKGSKKGVFSRDSLPYNILISVKVTPRIWLITNFTRPKIPMNWIGPLMLTLVLMIVSIIFIVSLVVRRVTKPLAALAGAAKQLGHGVDVGDLEEMGTQDVRNVTRSFNKMNFKIKRFVDDRTKMLAAISHDLRTPITTLRLRAEFIEDKEMQSKILETLDEMQVMTEATLKFAKDSNIKEKAKEIDLESLFEALAEEYQYMGKLVSLKEDLSRKQIILPLQVQAMKRAIRNIIDNGIKYGEQVDIDFLLNASNQQVEIYFRDQGRGIDPDEFENVFEPFFRLEKSRNRDTGGVGLGMSISRNIIRAHGGDVLLKNIHQDNKVSGLEVKVVLPL